MIISPLPKASAARWNDPTPSVDCWKFDDAAGVIDDAAAGKEADAVVEL